VETDLSFGATSAAASCLGAVFGDREAQLGEVEDLPTLCGDDIRSAEYAAAAGAGGGGVVTTRSGCAVCLSVEPRCPG
jgi:hypothetical protein